MKLPDADDWLPELPPLDGNEGDDEVSIEDSVTDADIELPRSPRDGNDDRPDDTLDIGEPIEISDIGESTSGDCDDQESEWKDDVEDSDLVGDDSMVEGNDEVEPQGDFGLDIVDEEHAESTHGADDGDVGPTDDIETFVEGDLPPMDADDGGDFEDELIREADLAFELEAKHPQGAVDLAWREVECLAMPLPIEAEDVDASVLLDPEDHDTAMVVTSRNGVGRAVGGRAFVPCNLWRELGGAAGALPSPEPFLAFLWSSGQRRVLWLATPGGRLLRGDRHASRWEDRGPLQGSGFRALAARSDGVLALLRCSAMQVSLLSSEDQRSWSEQGLPLAPGRYEKGRAWLALSGEAVAVGHPTGVVISRDGGRTFREVPGSTGAIAGVFSGEGKAAPLIVALLHEDQPRLLLARTDEREVLELVAQVDPGIDAGSDQDEARKPGVPAVSRSVEQLAAVPALGLVWDGTRGLVWVWWNGRTTAWGPRSLQ